MISERILKRWRREALRYPYSEDTVQTKNGLEMANKILKLTQEIMDLYLVKKGA